MGKNRNKKKDGGNLLKRKAVEKDLKEVEQVIKKKEKKNQKSTKNVIRDFRFSRLVLPNTEESTEPKDDREDPSLIDKGRDETIKLNNKLETDAVQDVPNDMVCVSDDNSNDDVTILEDSLLEENSSENELVEDDKQTKSFIAEASQALAGYKYYASKENNERIIGLILMKDSVELPISGKCQLEVIKGSLEILGAKISAEDRPLSVFSSSSSSSFALCETSHLSNRNVRHGIVEKLQKYFFDGWDELKQELFSHGTAVLLRYLPSIELEFNCKCKPYQQLFIEHPKIRLTELDTQNVVSLDQWKPVVNDIIQMSQRNQGAATRVLLCGNKNTGKSTFARFLANSVLNSCSSVFYLECDVGQTEFTPPGLISLSKIDEPLIGPPFTHQNTPVASLLFGNTSPRDDPTNYIRCIQEAFNYYLERCQLEGPLIINTQGWMKGLGLSLLVDIIRVTKPSIVLQFKTQSEAERSFYPLSEEFIQAQAGWTVGFTSDESTDSMPDHCEGLTEYRIVETKKKSNHEGQKLKAVDYRKLSLLAYFAPMFSKCKDACMEAPQIDYGIERPFLSLVPRIVYWKDVAVHVMHCKVSPSLMLASLNFSLISLAFIHPSMIIELPDKILPDGPKFLTGKPVASHVGYGFIRNIDIAMKAFLILTPVPYEDLQGVNALIKGNIGLPVEIFNQENISRYPYLMPNRQSEIRGTRARKPRYNLKRRKFESPGRS